MDSSPLTFDDLPNGIVVVRDGGHIVDANVAMLDLLGCDREALIGHSLSSILTRPAAMLYHASFYAQLRGAGRVDEAYLDFKGRDGTVVPALCTARLRRGESTQQIVISATRMTERRRLEEDLLRTRRITEQIPGAVYQYLMRADGTHCVPYSSEALRDMFGISPLEVTHDAAPLLERVHPDDADAFGRAVQRSAAKLLPWRHQFRARRSGHAPYRWLEGTATPERRADGATLWHGFIQDITERKGVEDALREKEASDQANRAKSEFLARVSHELRTPLNAIMGFAQTLSLDTLHPLLTSQRQRIEHIEEAGRDLLHLIDEVLDITRIESGVVQMQPAWVDMGALFARVVRVVKASARHSNVRIDIRAGAGLVVFADPTRLGQVVTNLLSNAIKYNREHGSVALTCAPDGDRMVIGVQDTGPGLTEQQVSQLFEPFNRLGAERTATEGTGLGLVIVKRLVEAMDGSIVVSSQPGHGSTFRVLLPLARASEGVPQREVVAPAAPFQAMPTPHRPAQLLYVEDNPVNAMVMQAICELRPGLELHVASTGASAIEWLRHHAADLLLIDMNLPDVDGIGLLQDLRIAQGQRLPPAIAVSADAMPHVVERARLAGFAEYVTKPMDVVATLELVETLLRGNVAAAGARP